MDLKITTYKDRLCREVDQTFTASAFGLSTAICEDVLNVINVDMFAGGLDALSEESTQELAVSIIKNGFPFFKELVKEIFNLTDEQIRYTKIEDIAVLIVDIVKYSFSQLSVFGAKKTKN